MEVLAMIVSTIGLVIASMTFGFMICKEIYNRK